MKTSAIHYISKKAALVRLAVLAMNVMTYKQLIVKKNNLMAENYH
ncbi:hypothetical protein [Chryseosolibacter histidini]|nr:hypothetical protein [Chryseosolibacter histidini]